MGPTTCEYYIYKSEFFYVWFRDYNFGTLYEPSLRSHYKLSFMFVQGLLAWLLYLRVYHELSFNFCFSS